MSKLRRGELPIPPPAADDPRALELVRVWAAGGKQHLSLASQAWRDPAAWGIMLVDLARHVANAFGSAPGGDFEEALARIKEGFNAEWNNPTT